MLRSDTTIDTLHQRQEGKLPAHFGLRITALTEGRIQAELHVQPWMLAPNGFLHAATQITLADTAAGYGAFAHLPDGARGFTTVELKTNFLGTAREGRLWVDCVADHLGRTTQVWSATVHGPDDRRLSLFRCTQLVLM